MKENPRDVGILGRNSSHLWGILFSISERIVETVTFSTYLCRFCPAIDQPGTSSPKASKSLWKSMGVSIPQKLLANQNLWFSIGLTAPAGRSLQGRWGHHHADPNDDHHVPWNAGDLICSMFLKKTGHRQIDVLFFFWGRDAQMFEIQGVFWGVDSHGGLRIGDSEGILWDVFNLRSWFVQTRCRWTISLKRCR